ncbi:MAG: GDSL family lipase [Ruminococcus sp.]|nr:GDSL family lipase [Ruminococcus sp.]
MIIRKKIAALLCASVMLVAQGCGKQPDSSKDSSQASQSVTSQQMQTTSQTTTAVQTTTTTTTTKGEIAMPANSVRLLGRAFAAQDGSIWMGLSGTGAEFDFTGEKLTVSLVGSRGIPEHRARVGIFVDGERISDLAVDENGSKAEIRGKGDRAVNVRIIKLSECAFSCCAITAIDTHGGKLEKSADKPRKIEFIGDSITCGYGVDDTDLSHGFSTATEDCTRSYAYKTAQALNADHSLVSYSGYGIVSGFTDNGEKMPQLTVPQYYESYGFTESSGFGTSKPSDLRWDFSAFVPDVIVINLGTNDSSYTGSDSAKQQEFQSEYVRFLKQIRAKNPKAKLICTLGTMGDLLSQAMKNAAAQYSSETGDENITTLDLPIQDVQADGVTVNYHPSEKTYEKAAALLTEKIKTEMNW